MLIDRCAAALHKETLEARALIAARDSLGKQVSATWLEMQDKLRRLSEGFEAYEQRVRLAFGDEVANMLFEHNMDLKRLRHAACASLACEACRDRGVLQKTEKLRAGCCFVAYSSGDDRPHAL